MHTASISDGLLAFGIETAHLLWSTVVFQPRSACRMYMCLILRDTYCDWGGQLEGMGFQPFSQLCTSIPAICQFREIGAHSMSFIPHDPGELVKGTVASREA